MEDKVLQNLITLYQSKGVSLDKLFQNPLFAQLPVEKKIELVKRYGSQAQQGTNWDSSDVKKILLGLGLAGLAVAVGKDTWHTIGRTMADPRNANVPLMNMITGLAPQALTAVGAGAMAANSLNSAYKGYEDKKRFYHLDTGSDNAIINYLARI